MMGLVIAANGLLLTQESEADGQEASRDISQLSLGNSAGEEASGFWGKLGKNLRQIGIAMAMPEIYLVIFYFLISGVTQPDFGDFSYYFMLNVVNISKFQYSMLGTIGSFTGIFGTMYYEQYLKDVEVRTLLYWSTVVSCASAFTSYALACRWN